MPRPVVEIRQEVANIVLTPANPSLPTCIVGPAYKVVEYPEDRGAGAAYRPNGLGTWAKPLMFDAEGLWSIEGPDPAEAQGLPWTDFGFDTEHTLDLLASGDGPPAAWLEDVYYLVKNDIDLNDVVISGANTLTLSTGVLSTTSPAGGTVVGDVFVLQSNMPQVLYDSDASAAFLSSVEVGATLTVTNTQGTSTHFSTMTFTVLQVIDDKRLLLGETAVANAVPALVTGAGASGASAATTLVLNAGDAEGADHYNGQYIKITSGDSDGEIRKITAYDHGTNTITVAAWAEEPDDTPTYEIYTWAFDTQAGVELTGALNKFGYSINNADLEDIVVADQRVELLKHMPVATAIQSVTSQSACVTAANLRFVSGANALSRANGYIERKLSDSTNGNKPGHAPLAYDVSFSAALVIVGDTDGDDGDDDKAVKVSAPLGTAIVTRCTVQVEARGVINNQPEFLTFSSIPSNSDFGTIGKVHKKNPLGMAMYVALSNAGATNILALAIASDDIAGYTAARSKLNSHDTVWGVVPLSTDLANVITPMKTDATAMSAPKKGKFRHVIAASEGLPVLKYVGPTLGGETDTGNWDSTADVLTDLNATFVTDGVVVGDQVVIATVPYAVKSVTNENVLVTEAVGAGNDSPLGDPQNTTYTIQRDISANTALQVAELKARIASAGLKRQTITYVGSCKVLGETGLPGYYVSAAIAGAAAGLPPHQPLNQVGLAAIEQIYDTNLHFSHDEIDELGDGGYMVFVQDSVSGLPYTVHQVTTGQIANPGVQEFAEFSVVRNFDYVSRVIKNRLAPFAGVWNFIPEAINAVSDTITSGIESMKADRSPKIGAPLLSGSIDKIGEAEANSAAMETFVKVKLPKVLNELIVHLVSE